MLQPSYDDILLTIHEVLSVLLLYSCFCRSVKMSQATTEREIRLAFWALSIVAVISVFGPIRGWRPDFMHIILLIAFTTVQFSTAKFWRYSIPAAFRKVHHE